MQHSLQYHHHALALMQHTCIADSAEESLQQGSQEVKGLQGHAVIVAQPCKRPQLLQISEPLADEDRQLCISTTWNKHYTAHISKLLMRPGSHLAAASTRLVQD